MTPVTRAACIGGGVIGAGWVARLVENGLDVTVYDPAADAEAKTRAVLANAERAYAKLTTTRRADLGKLHFATSVAEAVTGAEWIVESVPERLELKQAVYAEIEAAASARAVIASSTSGILPSELQARMSHPDRLLVAHPFNPVYLLPVVEIVGGGQTSDEAIDAAMRFYAAIGMKPVHIRKEIEAFVADRLLEAIWRESLWLIKDGICTTQELDDIVRFGFGLRYAQMGVFDTYRVAGGEAGMRHFMAQFGPCLKWPWTKLMDVPDFTDELVELIAGQSDAQSGHLPIRELERIRDDNLVGILHALKANGWGAGQVLADYEKTLVDANAPATGDVDFTQPVTTLDRRVPSEWTDYNGHMTEARYAQCFSDATDAFMVMIGCDAEYLATGGSYFTVENHVRFLDEVKVNEPITATTQLIDGAGKKLHLFHALHHGDGRLLATGETLLIHVSLASRAASEPAPHIAAKLAEIGELHGKLPQPEGLGRSIGRKT